MTNDRLKYLLDLFHENRLSDAESVELNNWYDQQQQINDELVSSEGAQEFIGEMTKDLMQRLFDSTESAAPVKKIKPFYWVAAASVIGVVFMLLFKTNSADDQKLYSATEYLNADSHSRKIINSSEKDTSFYLPDSSMVILHPGSSIQLDKDYGRGTRTIELTEGVGYFKVRRNKELPFIVSNQDITTTALGTAFTVKAATKGHMNVTLHEGKVVVSRGSSSFEPVYLSAGEELDINIQKDHAVKKRTADTIRVAKEENKPKARPVKQDLIFNQDSLSRVLRKLGTYYNIEIDFDQSSISKSDFSGRIRPSDKPKAVLGKIAILNELQVVETKRGFLLKKK